jgi:hypothetical protein
MQKASDWAKTIVEIFAPSKTEVIDLNTSSRLRQNERESTGFLDYQILRNDELVSELVFKHYPNEFQEFQGFVARDRHNALRFSKDVANGLLDRLAEILSERQQASQSALTALQKEAAQIETQ